MSILLFLFFLLFQFYKVNSKPEIEIFYIKDEFVVKEAKENYLIANNNSIDYLIYNKEKYNVGNKIYIEGKISEIGKDLDIDVFEFKDYLNNKRVFYQIEIDYVEMISSNISTSEKIVNYITKDLKDESYSMSMMLLFNDTYVDKASYENLKNINAVHLFVVSGFHISFLFSLISKIFKKSKVGNIIALSVLLIYVFLLDFSISAVRAFVSLTLNKTFKEKINQVDCVSIAGILLLFIEPLNIYNFSYIMSFLITIAIIFISNSLAKANKIIKVFAVSVFSFFVMIPIQLILNYKINVLSAFTNILLSYIVIVIFILCIIGLFISPLNGNVFKDIYIYFNKFIEKLASLDTNIIFGSMKTWMIVIYYVLIAVFLLLLEKKKKKSLLINSLFIFLSLTVLYFKNYINPYQKVTFLNVYQGDCIIIQDSFSDDVMLIDTGGLLNYDIAGKKIIPYLQYNGIKNIDIVVITHDDFDHNGALNQLVSLIDVEQIITDNNFESIDFGKIQLININSFYDETSDKNDTSIVLYGNIGGYDFLFAADISSKIEKKIINKYETLNVDILKVAHHGSKSSTCNEFIIHTSPEYGIISVGENNYYGHPNENVIETLTNNNVIVYRTDQDGTIRFIIKNDKTLFVETAK